MVLTWPTVPGAVSYKIARNGVEITTVPVAGYTDRDLTHRTGYCYTVRAVNASGVSPDSNSACAQAMNDYDGLWRGTSEGRAVSFRVRGRSVTELTTTASASGCSSARSEVMEGLSATISDNDYFSVDTGRRGSARLQIGGQFTSETAFVGGIHSSEMLIQPCNVWYWNHAPMFAATR